MRNLPPLSLYIHLPWCIRKCPYCDFNSHALKTVLPEVEYVVALLRDLEAQLPYVQERKLSSIFLGGGTPSLFSGEAIKHLLTGVKERVAFCEGIEITLEANPGAIDQTRFYTYREAGVNRLSLGVQSFQDAKLQILGRIHQSEQALKAIEIAKAAGFNNFNIDIMYGLPQQTLEEALADVQTALACEPTHFSWYQLTLEPNTLFYHQPPVLPADDALWEMQLAGQQLIQRQGFSQYEVSAYAKQGEQCVHNLNYWQYGDYLGIGAGAHAKVTQLQTGEIIRFAQIKHPKIYLENPQKINSIIKPQPAEVIFEFMLNALRLTNGVEEALFVERTGIAVSVIEKQLNDVRKQGLLLPDKLQATPFGKQYLNNLIETFLPLTC